MSRPYVPDRGHVVWLSLHPPAGHRQAGRRPAPVLSPVAYNRRAGLALLCPITTKVKGYPFEVQIPSGLEVECVVLADQIRSLDWRARHASRICVLPAGTVDGVLQRTVALLTP